MEKLCDLHTHSVFSDGTCTPEELLALAENANLAAVALTDHNTVAGLPRFLKAAQGKPVAAVPGIEFSADYRGREVHILGLFIKPDHYGKINALLEEAQREKERSNEALCRALSRAGLPMDYSSVRAAAPGQVNRAVIAREMVRLGYCDTVQEAFSRWLSPKRGYYQPPRRLDACEVIAFIRSIGAVAVLAHPFLNLDEDDLREFLPMAKESGLQAMEVRYSEFDPVQTEKAGALAAEFGLAQSGGSDFHGANKPHIRVGRGRGELRIPLELMEILRDMISAVE